MSFAFSRRARRFTLPPTGVGAAMEESSSSPSSAMVGSRGFVPSSLISFFESCSLAVRKMTLPSTKTKRALDARARPIKNGSFAAPVSATASVLLPKTSDADADVATVVVAGRTPAKRRVAGDIWSADAQVVVTARRADTSRAIVSQRGHGRG